MRYDSKQLFFTLQYKVSYNRVQLALRLHAKRKVMLSIPVLVNAINLLIV